MIYQVSIFTLNGILLLTQPNLSLLPNSIKTPNINTIIKHLFLTTNNIPDKDFSTLDYFSFEYKLNNVLNFVILVLLKKDNDSIIKNKQLLLQFIDGIEKDFLSCFESELYNLKNFKDLEQINMDQFKLYSKQKIQFFMQNFDKLTLKSAHSSAKAGSKPRKFNETNKYKGVSSNNSKKKEKQRLDFSNEDKRTNNQSLEALVDKKDQLFELKTIKTDKKKSKSTGSGVFEGILSAFNKNISEKELDSLMERFKNQLTEKNVAYEVSSEICNKIKERLLGMECSKLKGVDKLFKQELYDLTNQILDISRTKTLLQEIETQYSNNKAPYVITFVGVNGVGKSTNLSKIAYYLINNKMSVLIVACDTFRAGAIEQLKVHEENLNYLIKNNHFLQSMGVKAELYQRGYSKDAARIAMNGIQYAKDNNFNVVLVDTAGRMQNNEPLMQALSKLINMNNPNQVWFVGEALVGNESIDQLKKFNQAIRDKTKNTKITGIVLTKFDTVDDKIGAALSMSYLARCPIYFVGSGQTYTDLHSLDTQSVVDGLINE